MTFTKQRKIIYMGSDLFFNCDERCRTDFEPQISDADVVVLHDDDVFRLVNALYYSMVHAFDKPCRVQELVWKILSVETDIEIPL